MWKVQDWVLKAWPHLTFPRKMTDDQTRLAGPFDADVSGYVVSVLSLTIGFTKITFTVTMLDLSFKILLAGGTFKIGT